MEARAGEGGREGAGHWWVASQRLLRKVWEKPGTRCRERCFVDGESANAGAEIWQKDEWRNCLKSLVGLR
jgi:hypothetical protein